MNDFASQPDDELKPRRKFLATLKLVASKAAPFGIAFLYGSLTGFLVWPIQDASFQPALSWARYDLCVPDEFADDIAKLEYMRESAEHATKTEIPSPSEQIRETALGPRIWMMKILLCGTVVSLLMCSLHMVLNRSNKSYVAAVCLSVVGFGALIHQYDNLMLFAVRRRIIAQLPHFERVIAPLLEKWPKTSGTLPEIGKYFAHEDLPDQIIIRRHSQHSMQEMIGYSITRLPDDGVSIGLDPHYLFDLEYHPPNSAPLRTLKGKYWTRHLTSASEIQLGWYLTKYESVRND